MAPYRGRRNIGRKVLIHKPKLVETPSFLLIFMAPNQPTIPPSLFGQETFYNNLIMFASRSVRSSVTSVTRLLSSSPGGPGAGTFKGRRVPVRHSPPHTKNFLLAGFLLAAVGGIYTVSIRKMSGQVCDMYMRCVLVFVSLWVCECRWYVWGKFHLNFRSQYTT